MARETPNIALSVVVPVFNEEEVLREFSRRLSTVLSKLPLESEIVYVNDGSTDRTSEEIRQLKHNDDGRVGIVELSRNFGKEVAMAAGMDHAKGDAVIFIDADLQDPPELIPMLVQEMEKGFDVVYAKRMRRDGESMVKKTTAYLFYRFIGRLTGVSIPEDSGDFRILGRRAVQALKRLKEQHRFMKGLFAWIGFSQKALLYNRDGRFAGKTKWNYWKLWNFALEGITSFTIAPLKAATYLGVLIAFGAFSYASIIMYRTFMHGSDVPGYPSLMVTILLLGGVQLIAIGLVGEYLGRMFDETKGRPLYLVADYIPPGQRQKSCDISSESYAHAPN